MVTYPNVYMVKIQFPNNHQNYLDKSHNFIQEPVSP